VHHYNFLETNTDTLEYLA